MLYTLLHAELVVILNTIKPKGNLDIRKAPV